MILLKKRKNVMNELPDDVDLNKLCFKYEGPTEDINFNEYFDVKNF